MNRTTRTVVKIFLIAAGTAAVCLALAALHTFDRDPLRDTRPFAYTMPFGTAGTPAQNRTVSAAIVSR